MDAIRVNIRSDGAVSNKAVFVALAILPDGTRDVLGLWFQANEGAKFWAKVLNDLRTRGVQDILIAVVDGLKGFPQAIEALNSKIRRAVRTRGHFPSDEAAAKLIYLALNATSTEWKRSVREWHAVRSQLAIMFEHRFPMA